MQFVKSINEIGVVPLQVNGHLMRISMAPVPQQKHWLHDLANFYPVLTWIRKNCPNSTLINDFFTSDPVEDKPILLVDFSNQDLEAFCTHWEYVDNTSHEPRVDCHLLLHGDYAENVRREVRELGIHESPAINTISQNQWDYDLSDEENRKRWHDVYRLRHINGQVTQWGMLDQETQSKLIDLNDQLREVERWSFAEIMAIRGRVPDVEYPGSFKRKIIDDYPFSGYYFQLDEVKIDIAFVMAESDTRYNEDDDNYLYIYKRTISGLIFDSRSGWETGFAKSDNQKARLNFETEPIQRCYLFNHLMNCAGLDLADLLCISDVFVDVIYTGSHVSLSLTDPNEIKSRSSIAKRPWADELLYSHRYDYVDANTSEKRIAPRLQLNDLNDADQEHCQRINTELSQIERQTHNIGSRLIKRLNARLADENDELDDFEIQLYVSHLLHPSDELAIKQRHNLLLRQNGPTPSKSEAEPHYDLDHIEADWPHLFSQNDWSFPECRLFHELHDNLHDNIPLADLSRIDRIHAIFEVWLQRFVSVGR